MWGGRKGDAPCIGLSATMNKLQFKLNRLTTSTPPRIHTDSIDYACVAEQKGDPFPVPFSFMCESQGDDKVHQVPQMSNWSTRTNERTHEFIRKHMHLLPKFEGNEGKGVGPRYVYVYVSEKL